MFAAIIAQNLILHGDTISWKLLIPSEAHQHMPVRIQEYVELRCDRPQLILLTPLSFNLILLLLGSVFAFLTRQLPDAFNESWYILLSVTTTLIIWIAVIPTYFVTFYAYHREALLSLALTLNTYCNLIFLFAPKVYALFWVKDEDIQMKLKDDALDYPGSNKSVRTNESYN